VSVCEAEKRCKLAIEFHPKLSIFRHEPDLFDELADAVGGPAAGVLSALGGKATIAIRPGSPLKANCLPERKFPVSWLNTLSSPPAGLIASVPAWVHFSFQSC
jgi:hypothetical protein